MVYFHCSFLVARWMAQQRHPEVGTISKKEDETGIILTCFNMKDQADLTRSGHDCDGASVGPASEIHSSLFISVPAESWTSNEEPPSAFPEFAKY